MIAAVNNCLLFVVGFILGITVFLIKPTPLWVGIFSLYYGLFLYGSHYYTGKLAIKAFRKYKPDESKPAVLNAAWDWVKRELNK